MIFYFQNSAGQLHVRLLLNIVTVKLPVIVISHMQPQQVAVWKLLKMSNFQKEK